MMEGNKEMIDLETLSDEQLVDVISRGAALWQKRRERQIKDIQDRHQRLNSLLVSSSPVSPVEVKKRGRKTKPNANHT